MAKSGCTTVSTMQCATTVAIINISSTPSASAASRRRSSQRASRIIWPQLFGGHFWLASVLFCLTTTIDYQRVDGHYMRMTQSNNHANISELLDNLLRGYDNSVRPGFGGSPAVVEVDIMVRSMGPISEVDMTYSMDCYFRQSWVDRRLAFVGAQDTLALSISMLAKIWKPDTYFYNGKQSYLHTITTPNKFVRLHQDGRVLYSSRLTIKAGCPMNLEDFPMDVQRCPLKFGSFGYTTADVIYKWNGNRQAVTIAEDMKLSQFDLVDCPAGNMTDVIGHGASASSKWGNSGNGQEKASFASSADAAADRMATSGGGDQLNYVSEYSMLLVNFHLQRHMGNFLIQVYGPCVLLVVLSWVSFWLNREATADRVSLGITTVLTMTFLGLEARTDLPKVPYPTALDFFVFLSFAFIFATIIQFAVVHYFTKYGSGEHYFTRDLDSDSDNEDDEHSHVATTTVSDRSASEMASTTNGHNNDARIFEVIPLSSCSMSFASNGGRRLRSHRSWCLNWPCRRKPIAQVGTPKSTQTYPVKIITSAETTSISSNNHSRIGAADTFNRPPVDGISRSTTVTISTASGVPHRKRISFPNVAATIHRAQTKRPKRMPRFNSVSKIDRASRVFFPLVFFVINLFYWYSYLTKSERWVTQSVLVRQ